jgi:hypothetical protein
MKINFLIFFAVVLAACAKQTQHSERSIQQDCRLELEAARTAVQLRDEGKSKQAMMQSLPPLTPNSTRLLQQMYHIVYEVYAFPNLNEIVYGAYRYDYCAHQLRQQPVPAQIQDIMPKLLACQTQFGMAVSKQAVDCVRAVFPVQLPTTPGTNASIEPQNS